MNTQEELTKCPDCQVDPGSPHVGGCDVARCVYTGRQYIACFDLEVDEDGFLDFIEPTDHSCSPNIWSGEWPGIEDCRRLGWYTDPDSIFEGREDLNRIVTYGVWNRELQRWDAR